ncbi:MAG: hypothetical protein KIT84_40520 [Labilithrix sp.]|nr:hypothetical protein [Labilithrix sp.]MCW5817353.1 hypothetical protein [Labilithrix sp.]
MRRSLVTFALLALVACGHAPAPVARSANAATITAHSPVVYVAPEVALGGASASELRTKGWDRALANEVTDRFREVGFRVGTSPLDSDIVALVTVSTVEVATLGSNVVRLKSKLDVQRDSAYFAQTTWELRPAESGSATVTEILPLIAQNLVYRLADKPEIADLTTDHPAAPAPPPPAAAPAMQVAAAPAPAPPPPSAPPDPTDMIVLRDKTRITGRVTDQSPGEWVTIEENGRTRTFPWHRVDEVFVAPRPK